MIERVRASTNPKQAKNELNPIQTWLSSFPTVMEGQMTLVIQTLKTE